MLTLKDIMDMDILKDATVINEPEDFSEVKVDYISVQEPPVEGFVRENEIVISTAAALDDTAELTRFIQDVYQAKAAALIFSFKPGSQKELNQDVIDLANAHQLPLIEIPWNVRFSDVIEAVTKELKAKDLHNESTCIKLQEKLLQLYFMDESLEHVAERVAVTTGHSIKITDKHKNEKGRYIFDDAEAFHEIEIKVNNTLYGYLYIAESPHTDEEPVDIDLLNHYINVPLSLWFEKEEVINITGLKLKNDYVWKLAIEKDTTPEIVNQGVQLGFNMDALYFCVLLKIHSHRHAADHYHSTMITKIEKKIIVLLQKKNIQAMISFKNDRFILFLENQPELDTTALLDEIEQVLSEMDPSFRYHWGIAERTSEKNAFPEQYRKAKIALEQALDLNISRLDFRQSRITSLINQMTPRHKVREQAYALLDVIIQNDRYNENGMDLIQTVIVYIKTNLNTSETSRELSIHRQSLLYRLAKFEELTTLSLNNADDLFLLQYYLRLLGKFQ